MAGADIPLEIGQAPIPVAAELLDRNGVAYRLGVIDPGGLSHTLVSKRDARATRMLAELHRFSSLRRSRGGASSAAPRCPASAGAFG